jgi:hypothetical protein
METSKAVLQNFNQEFNGKGESELKYACAYGRPT